MKIICRTNLDVYDEQWPTELPYRPMVGDYIMSATKRQGTQLQLRVVSVSFEQNLSRKVNRRLLYEHSEPSIVCCVELHLPPHRFENISSFTKWYDKIRSGC